MRLLLVILCLLVALAPASAAITPQIESEATRLMDSGDPAAANALLRRNFEPTRATPQHWFLIGLTAYRARDLAGAETAFRRSLALDGNAQRVKLELARVLQERGQASEAERLFLEVRSNNPPAQVAANIDRYLAMLQDRSLTGSAWRARATLGMGYDSNVANATSAASITLFGLPFTLNADARKRGDGFGFFKSELDHVHRFDREFAWVSSLVFGARKYFQQRDYDSYTLYGATGPMWQPGEKWTILLPAFVNIARIENRALKSGERFYTNEVGVAPQVRYALDDAVSLNLSTVFSRKHYFEISNRDTNVYAASPNVDFRTPNAGTFTIGATVSREASKQAVWSNTALGATLGWQYAFSERFVGSLYATHSVARYDEREAAFDAARRDRKTVVGLDLIYAWQALGIDVLYSYAHTWNMSNLALYQYTKDAVSLGARKQF